MSSFDLLHAIGVAFLWLAVVSIIALSFLLIGLLMADEIGNRRHK